MAGKSKKPLTQQEVDAIRAAVRMRLFTKTPLRLIVRMTGIPRSVVQAIAAGTWNPRVQKDPLEFKGIVEKAAMQKQRTLFRDSVPFERCGSCGGKVKLPCYACELKAALVARKESNE